jgi:membrane protein
MAKTASAGIRRSELWSRLRRFVQLWIDLFARHDLLNHASAIAFQVLKSIIPLTLLGLALLGALGQRHVWSDTIAPAMEPHLQKATFHAIDAAAQRIFSSSAAGLLAFSALLSIWYVSGGVRAAMGGINDVYEAKETRPWLVRYAISFALAICISICVVGALLLAATGIGSVGNGALQALLDIGRWVVAVAALAVAVALLVRFAPVKHRPTRWASAGSVLVIAAWVAATLIFKLFVTHLANFKTASGSLAVFLVLIGYVYTSSIIFLVGVEVDELLREDAKGEPRGVFHLLFGFNR